MNPADYFEPLQEQLLQHAHDGNAAQMEAYLKGKFKLYGIKQGPRRAIFNDFVKRYGLPEYEQLRNCLKWLYEQDQREYDYCAVELLLKFKRNWKSDVLSHAEYLIVENSWWDTVDLIATNIVGAYLFKNPGLIEEVIPKMIQSDNMWLNRTAIIYQLKYRDKTDVQWLSNAILPHIDSTEFFHQKAIGWALRQYAKFNPEWVLAFVEEHTLKPLSRREALRLIKN